MVIICTKRFSSTKTDILKVHWPKRIFWKYHDQKYKAQNSMERYFLFLLWKDPQVMADKIRQLVLEKRETSQLNLCFVAVKVETKLAGHFCKLCQLRALLQLAMAKIYIYKSYFCIQGQNRRQKWNTQKWSKTRKEIRNTILHPK